MTRQEREAVLAFLKSNEAAEGLSLPEQRTRMDSLAAFFPVADGTEVEPATVGGIKGEWVRARHARTDAVVLYLHGGGYVVGSPASHRHLLGAVSDMGGLVAFAPDYRLAPEHPFPAAVDDAVATYKGLLDSGFPANKIAIMGDSAGGGLTIAALVAARDKGLPMPACAVAISPWADLTQSGETYRTRAGRDPMLAKKSLDESAALYLGSADARSPLASPVFADMKGLPPLLIQVGTEEVLHGDSQILAARADEAGVDVSLENWGGMAHVWHIFHPLLGEGRDAIARIASFVKTHIA
ncbi:MAG TPA: alpha/beta hydrolase [Rhizomicrobium sp.]|jgi:acetyl esterase/lipase|nr:alpha/beta hydrolase [Rhizomicrobium sp.]